MATKYIYQWAKNIPTFSISLPFKIQFGIFGTKIYHLATLDWVKAQLVPLKLERFNICNIEPR
jgi:hypothetical protein